MTADDFVATYGRLAPLRTLAAAAGDSTDARQRRAVLMQRAIPAAAAWVGHHLVLIDAVRRFREELQSYRTALAARKDSAAKALAAPIGRATVADVARLSERARLLQADLDGILAEERRLAIIDEDRGLVDLPERALEALRAITPTLLNLEAQDTAQRLTGRIHWQRPQLAGLLEQVVFFDSFCAVARNAFGADFPVPRVELPNAEAWAAVALGGEASVVPAK